MMCVAWPASRRKPELSWGRPVIWPPNRQQAIRRNWDPPLMSMLWVRCCIVADGATAVPGQHTIDTIMQVINDEPVPTRLQPRLPKDIETICLKCLSKDPKKRYATVAELDADLQRFINDEPIQARPIAWWERTWKAAKRRPTLAGLIVTAILAVGIYRTDYGGQRKRLQNNATSLNRNGIASESQR